MADNSYRDNSEQRAIAHDEVGNVIYQRVKLVWGADNTCTDVSAAAPLPVAALPAGTAAIGDVGTQYRANATGAASRSHVISAASTNATIVKASAGRLLGWNIHNANAAVRYVKFHNLATSPTAGSTAVFLTVAIPPGASRDFHMPGGIAFATGISYTTTTGIADSDSQAVGASDLAIDVFFA